MVPNSDMDPALDVPNSLPNSDDNSDATHHGPSKSDVPLYPLYLTPDVARCIGNH